MKIRLVVFIFLIPSLLLNVFLSYLVLKEKKSETNINQTKLAPHNEYFFTITPTLSPTSIPSNPNITLIKYLDFFNIEIPKNLQKTIIQNNETLVLNDFIIISNTDYNECFIKDKMCLGDCPNVKEEYVYLNGLKLLQREVEIGAIGGNIPKKTLSYGFIYKDRCLLLEATSLDYSLEKSIADSTSFEERIQKMREVDRILETRNSPYELTEERKDFLKKIINNIRLIY